MTDPKQRIFAEIHHEEVLDFATALGVGTVHLLQTGTRADMAVVPEPDTTRHIMFGATIAGLGA